MSRVGKRPIVVPPGVEIRTDKNQVSVKGSRGELSRVLHPAAILSQESGILKVTYPEGKGYEALWGLTRTLVFNMVEGVTKGFEKELEISGVGYRAQKSGEKLVLQVGFSHPVEFEPPVGIALSVEGTNKVKVAGADKEAVGETAARIRSIHPCDSYKGKGIKYSYEKLRLKPGKAGKAAAKK